MREITARNELKNWAKEIMIKLNNMNETNYLKHKSFVIRIFATILIYKASSKILIDYSKDYINKDYIWNKVQKLFNNNKFVEVDLDKIDDDFFHDVIEFSREFCNRNYEHLDNLLAWVYQYLNINRIDNINKDTQFFTDEYIVEYLVNKSINELKLKQIDNIYSIDPACGGGNFIVALIERIYYTSDMEKYDFIKYIGDYVVGYDIDKNLVLICVINIYIKFIELKILDIDELFKYNLSVFYDEGNKFGSLLKDIDNKQKLFRATDYKEFKYNDIFNNKYNLLITNPPFKGRREQDSEIRKYITDNYSVANGDICNSFVDRLYDLINDSGVASFVMQNGWMYLDTFKDLRKKIINEGSITSIVDLGSNSFYDLSGEKANISLLIYTKKKVNNPISIYGLKQYSYSEKCYLLKECGNTNKNLYTINISDIIQNNDFRIEYLSPGNIKNSFSDLNLYNEYARPMQGTSTGDSKKFVKYHWEVYEDNEWILVSKGGGYCKWSGLNIFKVKWGNNGEEISAHKGSVLRNIQYFDSTELVYSDTGTSGLSVRLLRKGQIFIASGPGIRILKGDKYCHLAFLNSRLASYYIKVLTPKLTISAIYIGKIPVIEQIFYDEELSEFSCKVVGIKEEYNKKRPINYEYIMDDFIKYNSIYLYAKNDFINDLNLEKEKLRLETEINKKVISYYNYTNDEIEYIYSKVGKNPYEIDKNIEILDSKNLDKLISKNLDNNCNIKSTRNSKETLGIEGILEFLAVNHGIRVEHAYEYILDNVNDFEKTILKYYKHTLHRIRLAQINYLGQNDKRLNEDVIKVIINDDNLNYNMNIDINTWFENEIYTWHFNSFLKRPIITNGDNINEQRNYLHKCGNV